MRGVSNRTAARSDASRRPPHPGGPAYRSEVGPFRGWARLGRAFVGRPAVSLDRISPRVRTFVAEHIDSVTELELLLLLHRDPAAVWTAADAAREMRMPRGWAAAHLGRFSAAGLLTHTDDADPFFSYRADNDAAAVIDEVAETFRRRRTSMTALIFSPTTPDIALLSDAFRIRRDVGEDD